MRHQILMEVPSTEGMYNQIDFNQLYEFQKNRENELLAWNHA